MSKFSIDIEAVQYKGTLQSRKECVEFIGMSTVNISKEALRQGLYVPAYRGINLANEGDYIVKFPDGEFIIYKEVEFKKLIK